MTTTPKGTWTQNDNDDFDPVTDNAATAASIDLWTTGRYERSANSILALGDGDFRGQLAWINLPAPGFAVVWNGSAWIPVNRMRSGAVLIAPTAANVPASATVSFPAGFFSAAPTVVVSANTTGPNIVSTSFSNATASSVTIWLSRTNTNSTSVSWFAFQGTA